MAAPRIAEVSCARIAIDCIIATPFEIFVLIPIVKTHITSFCTTYYLYHLSFSNTYVHAHVIPNKCERVSSCALTQMPTQLTKLCPNVMLSHRKIIPSFKQNRIKYTNETNDLRERPSTEINSLQRKNGFELSDQQNLHRNIPANYA